MKFVYHILNLSKTIAQRIAKYHRIELVKTNVYAKGYQQIQKWTFLRDKLFMNNPLKMKWGKMWMHWTP